MGTGDERGDPGGYDVIALGGGMAGLPIANRVAYKGLCTALVERETLGGTCLNRGCIPTKTMIHSARVAHPGPDGSTGRSTTRGACSPPACWPVWSAGSRRSPPSAPRSWPLRGRRKSGRLRDGGA